MKFKRDDLSLLKYKCLYSKAILNKRIYFFLKKYIKSFVVIFLVNKINMLIIKFYNYFICNNYKILNRKIYLLLFLKKINNNIILLLKNIKKKKCKFN